MRDLEVLLREENWAYSDLPCGYMLILLNSISLEEFVNNIQ